MASRLLPRGLGQARIGLQPHVSSDRRGSDPIQGERGRQGLLGPTDDLDVDERTGYAVHHPGHGQLHRDQAGMAASGSRLRLGRTRGSGSSPKGPPPGVVLGGFSFTSPPFSLSPNTPSSLLSPPFSSLRPLPPAPAHLFRMSSSFPCTCPFQGKIADLAWLFRSLVRWDGRDFVYSGTQ